MVSKQDKRAFNLYLLLLAHSQLINKDKFFLNLEDMGLSLDLPKDSTDTALRRQVIRSLRKLKLRYNLIDVDFYHGKNAFVTIPQVTTRSKFLLLVGVFVKTEGEDIESLTNRELRRRFGVSEAVFRQARKELHL